ncbi:unnamed protein product [Urochloa decumbens]|uniref:NADP-dependent oxidoreductase domain-containing protein n=1 Tax=Urochloa decumbens TaxID=240449 RepID=A0ABC8ZKR9_9POAL
MASTAEVALRSGSARPMPAVGVRGHGVADPRARRGHQGCRAGGHRGGVPPPRHRVRVPHGEAVRRGLVASREEVFVTSKLWCHPDLVLPSLRETLQYLQMEYVDLYLIHWPNWDGTGNAVLASEVLSGIAKARRKTVAQVALRWIYEQGVTPIVKSNNKERLQQNLQIFDWELTDEDRLKISQIPQRKIVNVDMGLFSQEGEFTSVNPADLDIVEE